jgi:hypothetical protein
MASVNFKERNKKRKKKKKKKEKESHSLEEKIKPRTSFSFCVLPLIQKRICLPAPFWLCRWGQKEARKPFLEVMS